MYETRYSFESYRNSSKYKEDMERVLNSGSRIDRFDCNPETQNHLSLHQLLPPFDV